MVKIRARSLIKGLMTFVPGAQRFMPKQAGGATGTAEYCYGVWMKDLTMLHQHGVSEIPVVVAELGPDASLGVGLSAMLSGADRYYALDVIEFANVESSVEIFDELVRMFRRRAPVHVTGFPPFGQYLSDGFPRHILTDEVLHRSLSKERVAAIRKALQGLGSGVDHIAIGYMVPWFDTSIIETDSVDLVVSHSVLEHIVDLELTDRALRMWLRPNGVMPNQIDFSSHGLTDQWNGYRGVPEFLWKAMLGKRDFLINREPYSVHHGLVLENGFELLCDLRNTRSDGIRREKLTRRWKQISDSDLACSGAFIQARKRP